MAERPPSPAERDLERALSDLGSRLAYPPTPDLARAVRLRLATQPPGRRFLPAEWFAFATARRRLAVAALAAVLLVIAAALAASPDLRTAVASRLGLKGVSLIFVDEVPTPAPSPVGTPLLLGHRVTLDEARDRAPYEILVPARDGLGEPDEVYLGNPETPGGTLTSVVSLAYRARADLPAAPVPGSACS